ncbi:dentin matrix acidic phosphoprotein 1-like [Littorina saxatilis]|uniref:dentin matrix acidic phosphoprotein 1-like n=1 Tax=Littorina saxatilis TaxID=31220 RepID=UPI0038B66611
MESDYFYNRELDTMEDIAEELEDDVENNGSLSVNAANRTVSFAKGEHCEEMETPFMGASEKERSSQDQTREELEKCFVSVSDKNRSSESEDAEKEKGASDAESKDEPLQCENREDIEECSVVDINKAQSSQSETLEEMETGFLADDSETLTPHDTNKADNEKCLADASAKGQSSDDKRKADTDKGHADSDVIAACIERQTKEGVSKSSEESIVHSHSSPSCRFANSEEMEQRFLGSTQESQPSFAQGVITTHKGEMEMETCFLGSDLRELQHYPSVQGQDSGTSAKRLADASGETLSPVFTRETRENMQIGTAGASTETDTTVLAQDRAVSSGYNEGSEAFLELEIEKESFVDSRERAGDPVKNTNVKETKSETDEDEERGLFESDGENCDSLSVNTSHETVSSGREGEAEGEEEDEGELDSSNRDLVVANSGGNDARFYDNRKSDWNRQAAESTSSAMEKEEGEEEEKGVEESLDAAEMVDTFCAQSLLDEKQRQRLTALTDKSAEDLRVMIAAQNLNLLSGDVRREARNVSPADESENGREAKKDSPLIGRLENRRDGGGEQNHLEGGSGAVLWAGREEEIGEDEKSEGDKTKRKFTSDIAQDEQQETGEQTEKYAGFFRTGSLRPETEVRKDAGRRMTAEDVHYGLDLNGEVKNGQEVQIWEEDTETRERNEAAKMAADKVVRIMGSCQPLQNDKGRKPIHRLCPASQSRKR